MRTLIILLFLLVSCSASAAEAPSAEDLANAEIVPFDDEVPLELDAVSVVGMGFTLKQEAALRMVRQALARHKSTKREDKDVMVCWFARSVGSHRTHLLCARNGDLWALRPDPMFGSIISPPAWMPGYGRIMQSRQATNKHKLNKIFENLPGSADLDNEFVAMTLAGESPPRDIPSEKELDGFARAYHAVGVLYRAGAGDDDQIAAIEAEGLTLKSYNRLIELMEHFQTLKIQVAERLVALDNS